MLAANSVAMRKIEQNGGVQMAHLEYLKTLFNLCGSAVVDVGAGDGTYSRELDLAGAKVSAVEVDQAKVGRAKSSLPATIEVMMGFAEQIPLEADSQDLACLFFSLHHVPIDVQDVALKEIVRVLKPQGRLHIVEPYPYGSMFEMVRMVEDETQVRTHSHQLLTSLGQRAEFRLIDHKDYTLSREYQSFDTFLDKIVRNDPDRSANLHAVEAKMELAFHQEIEEIDHRKLLYQPCAAYHFVVSD
jgi:ubiquinone/menaquinone biosynthesis C-methylase UbiE